MANSIKIKQFLPKGILQNNNNLNLMLSGIELEFNRFLDIIKVLNRNLFISTIDDPEYADDRLKEAVPNIDTPELQYLFDLTVAEKVTLIEYLYSLNKISTEADLEAVLLAYGFNITVADFVKVTFNMNIGHINFPIYDESITHTFDVDYSVLDDIAAIKLLINTYRPAHNHTFYNPI